MTDTPVPRLTRLETYKRGQWVVSHAGVALLHPDRYAPRLADRGLIARATVLDENLQPTDEVYMTEGADLL